MLGAPLPTATYVDEGDACGCCGDNPETCWCDTAPPDLSALTDSAIQWSACETALIEDPDGNPIADGGEVGTVGPLEGAASLSTFTGVDNNPGPTYDAAGAPGECAAICFAPATDKGGANELLAMQGAAIDVSTLGVAVMWVAPAGPYTLLIPTSLDATSGWFAWDDGASFHVTNGDNTVAYSTASPSTGDLHVLIITIDEAVPASSIRLDGLDIEPPGSLWFGVSGSLNLSNVDVGAAGNEVCWLWAAAWSTDGEIPIR